MSMRTLALLSLLVTSALSAPWFYEPVDLVWGHDSAGERRFSLMCGVDYDGLRCTELVWQFSDRHDRCDGPTDGLLREAAQ